MPPSTAALRLKHLLDRAAALVLLVLLSPLFVAIGLVLWLQGDGILFVQERAGEGGRPFRIFKFTTMPRGADTAGYLTTASDPRPTAVGRLLRRLKLNELPQLLNVLRGDMSLVGPRPMIRAHLAESMSDGEIRTLYAMRPGITGAGSLEFADEDRLLDAVADRDRHFREVVLPRKVALEAAYARDWSLAGDVRILVRTLKRLLW
jgi:lipopolysaccharide/colanic/teichoic acid biosynthesis glycosyltransferase